MDNLFDGRKEEIWVWSSFERMFLSMVAFGEGGFDGYVFFFCYVARWRLL